jgi:hypothetical protein
MLEKVKKSGKRFDIGKRIKTGVGRRCVGEDIFEKGEKIRGESGMIMKIMKS